VCRYIYIYIYMYIYMCVYIHVYIYMYVCKYNYQSVCVQRKINTQKQCLHMHTYYSYTRIDKYVCIYACMYDGWKDVCIHA
jgi:hypothetical protein